MKASQVLLIWGLGFLVGIWMGFFVAGFIYGFLEVIRGY